MTQPLYLIQHFFSLLSFFTLNVFAHLTFFKRSQWILQNNYLILKFIKQIPFRTDLHMPVTMTTILKHLARPALCTCLRFKVTSDITFHQTFEYVVACTTSSATLRLYLWCLNSTSSYIIRKYPLFIGWPSYLIWLIMRDNKFHYMFFTFKKMKIVL